MLLAAGPAAAATGGLCAPATATAPDAACPRLTGARQHPIAGKRGAAANGPVPCFAQQPDVTTCAPVSRPAAQKINAALLQLGVLAFAAYPPPIEDRGG